VSKAVKVASEEPSFEDALGRLESIVEAMEADDLPLEQLLARFEEGTRLHRICQSRLAEAELKIQALEKNLAGEPVLRPIQANEVGSAAV
jgi:exodeoxyribonuclease VII small subunit